jgi:hypothetical protein
MARDEVPSSAKVMNASTPHDHGVVFMKWKIFIFFLFRREIICETQYEGLGAWR